MQPNDRLTKRQQDLLDMDEDSGSDEGWKYLKADGSDPQSEGSFRSVETHDALGGGPPPPPPTPWKPPPPLPPHVEPIGDPTRNRADTVVPPPCRPLPLVPGPPAKPRSDCEECEGYFKPKSVAETQAELRERSTAHMVALTAPDEPPRDDDANRQRCKDARAIANAHLSAATNPHLSRVRAEELFGPQLSRGPPSAASFQEGPAQSLRHARPPPPLPPPCYGFEYFTKCVRITAHWDQHRKALQYFSDWCRARGLKSRVLDNWNENIVPKQPYGIGDWSSNDLTWSWDSLLAQLTDDSLRYVVEGYQCADGIVACMVRESSVVDTRKSSAPSQNKRTDSKQAVAYYWEFAFLRTNGTVAFLRPQQRSRSMEYYEGTPTYESVVKILSFRELTSPATDADSLHEFVFGDAGSISCRLDGFRQRCPENWFPDDFSLDLSFSMGLKFMEYRNSNHATRGSACRPPPRRG